MSSFYQNQWIVRNPKTYTPITINNGYWEEKSRVLSLPSHTKKTKINSTPLQDSETSPWPLGSLAFNTRQKHSASIMSIWHWDFKWPKKKRSNLVSLIYINTILKKGGDNSRVLLRSFSSSKILSVPCCLALVIIWIWCVSVFYWKHLKSLYYIHIIITAANAWLYTQGQHMM
jgi:hypothetical protein